MPCRDPEPVHHNTPDAALPKPFLTQGLRRWWDQGPAGVRADLLAGTTVAAYLIPQCMAYGELAGMAPIHGLWAILPALLLYVLLGSSPQLSVGPESTTAVMTAAAIAPLAAGNGAAYASLSALLALLVGVVCCLGAAARLGFLADLLSRPILVGYMAGVAVIMITSQLGTISGIQLQAEGLPARLRELVLRAGEIHGPSLLLTLGVLGFLLVVQRRFPAAPGPLLAVLLATAAVAIGGLDQMGVAVIGPIPAGLPRFSLPEGVPLPTFRHLVGAAVGIALVGYSDNVLTARAFASRNGYRIDAQRELLALGAINLGNGLMQGFPVSSSGSRTALGDALGSRSQLFSLVALTLVLVVLLFLRPVLALFPKAALGAIVIYAALRLIDLAEFRRLLAFRGSEFRLALVTLAGVLLTDLLVGVGLAVGLSVMDLFFRLLRPHDDVMDPVPSLPGLVVYRFDAPLCFANAEHFRRRALEVIDASNSEAAWFVLNAEAIVEIDITAADVLDELRNQLASRGIVLAMAGVKADLYHQLSQAGLVERIGAGRFFPSVSAATDAFRARQEGS